MKALEEYRQRRNFSRTPEPKGARDAEPAPKRLSFVVQEHAARRLHYDFRLQVGDVLMSWAVPKGPSLDPSVRRLAVRTEDHPLEYAKFEGIIPEGQYGAGAVIVWDRGRWLPDEDPVPAFEAGKIRFTLFGEKLRGSWRLVRTGSSEPGPEQWLLIKSRDAAARPGATEEIVSARPESVVTGRRIEEVRRDPDRLWRAEEGFSGHLEPDPSTLPRARKRRVHRITWPEVVEAAHVPPGEEWLHEIGHDGVRVTVRCTDEGAEVLDVEGRAAGTLPNIVRTLTALPISRAGRATMLGIVTRLSARGVGRRGPAERGLAEGRDDDLVLMVFDLVELDGFDLTDVPLIDRKRALSQRLESAGAVATRVRFVDHVCGRGEAVEHHAADVGAGAILSKRMSEAFGRGRWLHVSLRSAGAEPVVQLDDEAERTLEATRFTTPQRVLYSGQGITKMELARYYAMVRERIMPHLEGRPLTLLRCPEGEGGECFYQKHVRPGVPKSLRRLPIRDEDEERIYMVADDLAGLLGLVQIGVLEIHGWTAKRDRLDRPDRMILDLDPDPAVGWDRVVAAAKEVRWRLARLDLQSFVTTTGKKGLHVVVPLERRADYDEVKDFSRAFARRMAAEAPNRFVAVQTKARRAGKIYVDYVRNSRGATAIVPYSTRAAPGAPVATPVSWEELDDLVGAGAFQVRTIPQRLADTTDPWSGFFEVRQAITRSRRRALDQIEKG